MRVTLTEHLFADDMEAYFLNRANAAASNRAEEHLLVCEQCQNAARSMEIELAAMRMALESICVDANPAAGAI